MYAGGKRGGEGTEGVRLGAQGIRVMNEGVRPCFTALLLPST